MAAGRVFYKRPAARQEAPGEQPAVFDNPGWSKNMLSTRGGSY